MSHRRVCYCCDTCPEVLRLTLAGVVTGSDVCIDCETANRTIDVRRSDAVFELGEECRWFDPGCNEDYPLWFRGTDASTGATVLLQLFKEEDGYRVTCTAGHPFSSATWEATFTARPLKADFEGMTLEYLEGSATNDRCDYSGSTITIAIPEEPYLIAQPCEEDPLCCSFPDCMTVNIHGLTSEGNNWPDCANANRSYTIKRTDYGICDCSWSGAMCTAADPGPLLMYTEYWHDNWAAAASLYAVIYLRDDDWSVEVLWNRTIKYAATIPAATCPRPTWKMISQLILYPVEVYGDTDCFGCTPTNSYVTLTAGKEPCETQECEEWRIGGCSAFESALYPTIFEPESKYWVYWAPSTARVELTFPPGVIDEFFYIGEYSIFNGLYILDRNGCGYAWHADVPSDWDGSKLLYRILVDGLVDLEAQPDGTEWATWRVVLTFIYRPDIVQGSFSFTCNVHYSDAPVANRPCDGLGGYFQGGPPSAHFYRTRVRFDGGETFPDQDHMLVGHISFQ